MLRGLSQESAGCFSLVPHNDDKFLPFDQSRIAETGDAGLINMGSQRGVLSLKGTQHPRFGCLEEVVKF